MKIRSLLIALCFVALSGNLIPASENGEDPEAIQQVLSGKRTDANAAWWGFDEEDSTEAIQSAINSGAQNVTIPNVGGEWIVRPITLKGNQTIILQQGVTIAAKRGEYRGGGDSVFTAKDIENVSIRGNGATIRMNKEDYIVGRVLKDYGWNRWFGQYEKAEWRMCLSIRGCTNVRVYGLTLRDSGGDGIYIDGGKQPSRNIRIQDVVCDNNYRQGMSIINVDGLRVTNCIFKNTWGTPPCAGVDIEPDSPDQVIKDIRFNNCQFLDNYGDGIEVFLSHMKKSSEDVSILFENCFVQSKWGTGIRVTKIHDDGPGGLVEFRRCVVDGTEGYGLKVQDKSADSAKVRFVNCGIRNAARNRNFADAWAPLNLRISKPERIKRFGGIEFVDCVITDDKERRPIAMPYLRGKAKIANMSGDITIRNPKAREVSNASPALALHHQNHAIKHVDVYYKPGRFGGWPANHGIWSWGNEILVGFGAGYYKDLGPNRHAIDRDKPEEHLLARSLDGGETWKIEDPSKKGVLIPRGDGLHGVTPDGLKEKAWRDSPGGIDFTHPDFAMTVRMTSAHSGPARYYYSYNRGHDWDGPFRLPTYNQKGIAARTDYLINGKHDAMLFLTAAKENGREGRPFCARTTDGGKNWKFVSWIEEHPRGFGIMPSTVRINADELLTAIRRRNGRKRWVETYRSVDNGQDWNLDTTPAPDLGEGNPPSMIKLKDGRICLTYGYRAAPWGIRARLSSDNGHTWGQEIILRDDGAGRDIGYPRTVQRSDGKLVTVYYYWDRVRGPERYIAATIWDPGSAISQR